MEVKKNNYSSFDRPGKNISAELIKNTPPVYQSHPEFGTLPWNAPCEDCYELLQKRTPSSRYFVKNNTDGKEFFIQRSYGNIHFEQDGYLKTTDWYLHPTGDNKIFEASSQPLPTKLDLSGGYSSITMANHDEFKINHQSKLFYQIKDEFTDAATINYSDYTVGKDGAYINDAWAGIDAEMVFSKSSIKTNFVISSKDVLDAEANYLIIEEYIPVQSGYKFQRDASNGYYLKNGDWRGDIVLLDASSVKLLTIQKPLIVDQNKTKTHPNDQMNAIAYELVPANDGYLLRIKVNNQWLLAPERKYPVIIDPLLIGEAVYTAGDMGFQFSGTCWDTDNYCNYFLDITVPGKTTLTNAYFDLRYESQLNGCSAGDDCWMSEAAFRILGPCDDSPSSSGVWTCLSPYGDSAGTCYCDTLTFCNFFNTVSCIAPQCADYNFTFELRTFHCSCNTPPCGILCHEVLPGNWSITIEGKTVEENAIISSDDPDFTICFGDSLNLFASGIYGVPPYEYEWLPDGIFTDTLIVSPEASTVYTSIIHDLCDMQDTVTQLVTVMPLPELSPGPFEGCDSVLADAGSGYVSYLWSTGEETQTVMFDSSGFYDVTVTDLNGCTGTSEPIEVIINTAPEIEAVPDTIFVGYGELAELHVTTTSTGLVTFTWSPAENVTCVNCEDPFGIIYNPQQYFYVYGEENGCISDPDTVLVINSQTNLIIPNAFTPNGDGLNEIFSVHSEIYYPIFEMEIYNRWGEKVFTSADMLNGWDGTYLNKQQEVGTYIWLINYEKLNDKGRRYTLRGTVNLLR